jgi:tetratricopeptide (TPR) repeat protein
MDFAQDDMVYPSLLSLYKGAPVGTLDIVNHEDAELRNVEVSFRAGDYTSSEFICGTIPLITRERRESMPLYADFSPKLMDFTENGRIAGEVVIRYNYLGSSRESVQSAVLQIAHRNSVPTGDPAALAALVSPTAPEILEYGKYVTGMARSQSRSGVNGKMQAAIWLFEGFRSAGLWQEGSGAPGSDAVVDIQYPTQTLAYRSGSVTDLGLAYTAALEASGIPSAFIALADDFIAAFYLGITLKEAASSFNGTANLLIVNDEVWLPLSMAAFNEGFSKSWKAAPPRIDRMLAEGEDASFIILQDAWTVYPSAPFPALGVRNVMPESKDLGERAETALKDYLATEIQPLIASVSKQISDKVRDGGAGQELAALHNRLGALYVRAGNMKEAGAAYEKAAGLRSVAAMNNRGNMALRDRDFAKARRWCGEVLRIDPENPAALLGLEKIKQRSEE